MERVSQWDRRLAALVHAIDVFQPVSVWYPEPADHEIAAVAFLAHLQDMHSLAKLFLSPAPPGFMRMMHVAPADAGESFESILMLELRRAPRRPVQTEPPPWPSSGGGGEEQG